MKKDNLLKEKIGWILLGIGIILIIAGIVTIALLI